MSTLSVIVPVYNEEKLVIESLKRLDKVDIINKVIVVDDCSTDNSYKLVTDFIINKNKYTLIKTSQNVGKGKAVAAAQSIIKTDYVTIHDADLEYFPEDLAQMYKKVENNCLILGSRFIGDYERSNLYKRTLFANYFLSRLFSILYKTKITDIATCYKMMPTEFFRDFKNPFSRDLLSSLPEHLNNFESNLVIILKKFLFWIFLPITLSETL